MSVNVRIKKRGFNFSLKVLVVGLFVSVSSCTYVTPEAENPTPGLEKASTISVIQDGVLSIKKHFFGIEINQETNKWDNVRKTWLCGWAPVSQSGRWKNVGGLTATPYKSRHCNMEFHISEEGSSLQAFEVDVDTTNVGEWRLIFTIPIQKHYFYEKDVDSRGRELNKYKKVTDRKNWELAPIMDLNLKGIQFHNYGKAPGMGSDAFLSNLVPNATSLISAYDIEVSRENDQNFLGFTALRTSSRYGSAVQHEVRFNFLEIKDNPNFKKTPYNKRTAKHMNILHILGSRPDGFHEVNYAAHWDVSSKPVEVCLNGFPEDYRNYKQIGFDVIDEMNKAMEKIGAVKKGQKAFVVSKRKPKYYYDLRCPSITWVDDPKLSFRAPLGIGLVNTNIKTGEILWGGAVIWGGLIHYIVNRESESASDMLTRNTHELLRNIELEKNNPYFEDIQNQLRFKKWSPGFKNLSDLVLEAKTNLNSSSLEKLMKTLATNGEQLTKEQEAEVYQQLKLLSSTDSFMALQGAGVSQFLSKEDISLGQHSLSEDEYLERLNAYTKLGETPSFNKIEKDKKTKANNGTMSLEKLAKSFRVSEVLDLENRVENHYYNWMSATANLTPLEKLAAAKSVIKNVTLHEWGHVVGLGHQFEGNRLPEKGMVPDKIYNFLAEEAKTMSNYSSIMDYQSGHTEVALPYEKVKMQVQDELVLNYLYNQKYSAFHTGDKEFTFFDVPTNGVIPNQTTLDKKTYTTRYMPQCSDVDAWLATSPYCRRWDRGYDAPTIVDENVTEFTESFISRMNSFTEASGGNPFRASARLWGSTYNLMNHNRTFYDKMRYTLQNNEVYRSVFDQVKKNERALLTFSRACVDPSLAAKPWQIRFAKLSLQPLATEVNEDRLEKIQQKANYRELYSKYESIVNGKNIRDLDNKSFVELERQMHEQGLAFTELQKLCRASSKSLDAAKLLLSLKGPDHPIMNYDNVIVPTGLRGANGTSDYSRMFGTYDQLGLLPIKLATLDLLTSTSSTMRYAWWRVGKPQFSDSNDGKYGYFSLYPKEFTDIVGTAVKNNMGFGGSATQEAASMSVSNLYMAYYLYRTFFWSNDTQARGFQEKYIADLKDQTKFTVQVSPILLEGIDKPGKSKSKIFGFRPKIFNLAKRTQTDLPEAYALPDRKVIIRGNDSQIILPVSKMRFLSKNAAYVWALNITYDKTSYDDPLEGYTVKNAVSELTTQELDRCMGGSTGLASYFSSDDSFEGFDVNQNIATDKEAQNNFEKSVDRAFAAYQSRENLTPQQNGCEESLKGVGLITSSALSLNGIILPQVFDYIKK